jgi:hypothetical protein
MLPGAAQSLGSELARPPRLLADAWRRATCRVRGWHTQWRARVGEDKALSALAAVADDEVGDLSEAGRRLRREARQLIRAREMDGSADRGPQSLPKQRWSW